MSSPKQARAMEFAFKTNTIWVKKLKMLRELLDALENYQPAFTRSREIIKLNHYEEAFHEDVQFLIASIKQELNNQGDSE